MASPRQSQKHQAINILKYTRKQCFLSDSQLNLINS